MNSTSSYLDKLFVDQYADMYLKLVAMSTPPVPVSNYVFMPDSFKSKVFDDNPRLDEAGGFDRKSEFKPVALIPTALGPAVLARIKLKHLVSVENGILEIRNATCCASLTFNILVDSDGLSYADNVNLDALELVSRSCHPGSHFSVPLAPYLTAMLHYAVAPEKLRKIREFRYMPPDAAFGLFSDYNFEANRKIDKFLSKCAVPFSVSWVNAEGGLGKWSRPYIGRLRRNLVDMGGFEHERWIERPYEIFGNAGQENDGKTEAFTDLKAVAGAVHAEGHGDNAS